MMKQRILRARLLAAGLAVTLLAGGALVITAATAGAVEVSSEAQLRLAFDTEADLLNDITLVDCTSNAGAVTRSVDTPVVVDGHGFTITQTCPANIFELSQSDVTLRDLTLTGGRERDDGGAIDMNGGSLTVLRSTLTGNCAFDSAGAIENEDGSTTIIESTLSDNFAQDQAGALRSKRGATTIVNSTITGNRQRYNGAVDSGQESDGSTASLTLVYDTIVDNAMDENLVCDLPTEADVGATDDDEAGAQQLEPIANVTALDDFASFGTVVALHGGGASCQVLNPGSLGDNYSDDATCGFRAPATPRTGPTRSSARWLATVGPRRPACRRQRARWSTACRSPPARVLTATSPPTSAG